MLIETTQKLGFKSRDVLRLVREIGQRRDRVAPPGFAGARHADAELLRALHPFRHQPQLVGLGTAELWHVFLSNLPGAVRPGTLGRVVPGFEVRVCDPQETSWPSGNRVVETCRFNWIARTRARASCKNRMSRIQVEATRPHASLQRIFILTVS